jgi:hypothetical protein
MWPGLGWGEGLKIRTQQGRRRKFDPTFFSTIAVLCGSKSIQVFLATKFKKKFSLSLPSNLTTVNVISSFSLIHTHTQQQQHHHSDFGLIEFRHPSGNFLMQLVPSSVSLSLGGWGYDKSFC